MLRKSFQQLKGVLITVSVSVAAFFIGATAIYVVVITPAVPSQEQPESIRPASQSVAERLSELDWNEDEALAVARKVRDSTVCIASSRGGCGGTGWVAGADLVVTCGHCIEHDNATFVRTLTEATMSATVLEILPDADLGILKVTSNISSLPSPLPTGFAAPGDPVIMVGHPSGVGTWVVTLGEVLAVDSWGEGGYTADLSGLSGSSGSAVVNRNGEVIGVYSGKTSTEEILDPYPFVILLEVETLAKQAGTVESGTKMRAMINRHR